MALKNKSQNERQSRSNANGFHQNHHLPWTDNVKCSSCSQDYNKKDRLPTTLACGCTLCRICLKSKKTPLCQHCLNNEAQCDVMSLPVNTAVLMLVQSDQDIQIEDIPLVQKQMSYAFYYELRPSYEALKRIALGLRPGKEPDFTRSMQRKLSMIINNQIAESRGRERTLRNIKSAAERLSIDLIQYHQSPTTLSASLWDAVRARGCQFLGPAMQEEALKFIQFALGDQSELSRKVLVELVVNNLQPMFPQASKTCIGHVVQLLYRASCFIVTKRDGHSSLMRLKDEYLELDELRREHDAQIVTIAREAGLRISPDQWSALLYGDQSHKSYMQSIIDRLNSGSDFSRTIQDLGVVLTRSDDPGNIKHILKPLEEISKIDSNSVRQTTDYQELNMYLNSFVVLLEALLIVLERYQSWQTQAKEATQQCSKYKTSMCRDFITKGVCPRGEACTFAHSDDELQKYRNKRRRKGIQALKNPIVVPTKPQEDPVTQENGNFAPPGEPMVDKPFLYNSHVSQMVPPNTIVPQALAERCQNCARHNTNDLNVVIPPNNLPAYSLHPPAIHSRPPYQENFQLHNSSTDVHQNVVQVVQSTPATYTKHYMPTNSTQTSAHNLHGNNGQPQSSSFSTQTPPMHEVPTHNASAMHSHHVYQHRTNSMAHERESVMNMPPLHQNSSFFQPYNKRPNEMVYNQPVYQIPVQHPPHYHQVHHASGCQVNPPMNLHHHVNKQQNYQSQPVAYNYMPHTTQLSPSVSMTHQDMYRPQVQHVPPSNGQYISQQGVYVHPHLPPEAQQFSKQDSNEGFEQHQVQNEADIDYSNTSLEVLKKRKSSIINRLVKKQLTQPNNEVTPSTEEGLIKHWPKSATNEQSSSVISTESVTINAQIKQSSDAEVWPVVKSSQVSDHSASDTTTEVSGLPDSRGYTLWAQTPYMEDLFKSPYDNRYFCKKQEMNITTKPEEQSSSYNGCTVHEHLKAVSSHRLNTSDDEVVSIQNLRIVSKFGPIARSVSSKITPAKVMQVEANGNAFTQPIASDDKRGESNFVPVHSSHQLTMPRVGIPNVEPTSWEKTTSVQSRPPSVKSQVTNTDAMKEMQLKNEQETLELARELEQVELNIQKKLKGL